MPTYKELQDGIAADSKALQAKSEADPSNLLLTVAAALDRNNQIVAHLADDQENFDKAMSMISPTGIGTIIGKGAKLFNATEAQLAEKLKEIGSSAESIWQNTKTYWGPVDGKIRQEIPDVGAKLKDFIGKGKDPAQLQELLDHPKLFEAYPELASLEVRPGNRFSMGTNREGKAVMMVDPAVLKKDKGEFLNVLLHEVQHGVQNIEGFTKGGTLTSASTTQAYRKLTEGLEGSNLQNTEAGKRLLQRLATTVYRKIGGEAEARAVQARQHYDPEDLRKIIPTDSYDVPVESLIRSPNK